MIPNSNSSNTEYISSAASILKNLAAQINNYSVKNIDYLE